MSELTHFSLFSGVSSRMDRLKCLGNAIVPQQIYPIFKYIAEVEKDMEEWLKWEAP